MIVRGSNRFGNGREGIRFIGTGEEPETYSIFEKEHFVSEVL